MPRLVKLRVLGTTSGTGWAVGKAGILTARHLVEELLEASSEESQSGPVAEAILGTAPDHSYSCEVIWDDASTDLALLSITEQHRARWREQLGTTAEPMLAHPHDQSVPDVVVTGFPDGTAPTTEGSSVAWMLLSAEYTSGTLYPTGDRDRRCVVEADRDTLSKGALRSGFSGAIVFREDPVPMVLGIITGKVRSRKKIRFAVSLLPEPGETAAFREALSHIGASPVVANMDGPILQQYVAGTSLDTALRPLAVKDITDNGLFGTRLARSDITPPCSPYFQFVGRPERKALTTALDHAVAGTGPRIIVLRGPSASGKSRLVAEVVRAHSALTDFRMVAPLMSNSILEFPDRLRPPRALIWIDNLQDYPSQWLTHAGTYRLLKEWPKAIIVGSVLDPPEQTGGSRLVDSGLREIPDTETGSAFPLSSASLSLVRSVIEDASLTETITVAAETEWVRSAAESDLVAKALFRAEEDVLGFGEFLSAYGDLADHYTAAQWMTRALVDLVVDWDASGIAEPLPVGTARILWDRYVLTRLPRDEVRTFHRLTDAQIDKRWREALTDSCTSILGSGSLVVETAKGLVSSEFSRMHIDHFVISAQVWDYLLNEHSTTPAQRLNMGLAALQSGTPRRALRAFESILYYRDDDPVDSARDQLLEVVARRGIALYHARSHRDEQAIMVYTDLVDTFDEAEDPDICEQIAQALLGIGISFSNLGSHGQAVSAYTELVRRYGNHSSPILDEHVAKGMLGQAITLGQLNRKAEEIAAYRDIVARYADDRAPALAAISKIAQARLSHNDEDRSTSD